MATKKIAITHEMVEEARQVREAEDATYKDLAATYLDDEGRWEELKAAMSQIPSSGGVATNDTPAPTDALAALEQTQKDIITEQGEYDKEMDNEIARASADRPLTDAELDTLERIYRNNGKMTPDKQVTFKMMGEALDPPRHWLTIQAGLGSRGWYTPWQKVPPYSTATKEGEAQYRKDRMEGKY